MSLVIDQELEYTAHNYAPLPVVLVKGDGCYLWDEEGNKYIDMMSAYSAVSHGHQNSELVDAAIEQLKTLNVTSRAFYTDQMAPFAKKLCEITGLDKALPMNTGSEAVETAIKAVRQWGYKVKNIPENEALIVTAEHNFHGRTTTIISFSTEAEYKENFGPFTPGFIHVPYGDLEALEALFKEKGDTICAFLVEPMQGEAGIIVPPKGWLKQVQKLCKEYHIKLVMDEIQTGLARTGKWFAYQHEIDKPDGVIMGKALGGGIVPVSCFVGSNEIMELFEPGSHGSTFGGNPLACHIALKALDIIERDNFCNKSADDGNYLMDALKAINSPLIEDVRGAGLWIGVEINPDLLPARKVCEKLMERGVLSKDTHETVVRFAPPLVITRSQLDEVIGLFNDVIGECEKELGV